MTLQEIFQGKNIEFFKTRYVVAVTVHVKKKFLRKAYDKEVFEKWEVNLAVDKDTRKTVLDVHRRQDNPHNKYKMYLNGNESFENINVMEDFFEEMDILKQMQDFAVKQEHNKRYHPDLLMQKQKIYQKISDELQNVKS